MFIPGITDGAFGSQLWMYYQEHRNLTIDLFKDEQDLSDINSSNWDKIKSELIKESKTKSVAARDFHALWMICNSNNNDMWITFYKICLWWTKVTDPQIHKDECSKFRKASKWSNKDIYGRK